MFELILFCVLLIICFGLGIWYSIHRQQVFDEMMESMKDSLSTIAECCVDVSCAVDQMDIEGGK